MEEMGSELSPEGLGTWIAGRKAKANTQTVFDKVASVALGHQKVGSYRNPENRKELL